MDHLNTSPHSDSGKWSPRFTPRTPDAKAYDLYQVDLLAADKVRDALPAEMLRDDWLSTVVRDAVVYALPAALQYADLWRNVLMPGAERTFGSWQHNRELADPDFEDFLSPNVDTLYSTAWLDLASGPVEIEIPEMGDRYYTVNLLDAYSNAVNLSTRTVGPGGGRFWIVPPGWTGPVPAGTGHLRVSTRFQWLLLRIFVRSPDDVLEVRCIQDNFLIRAADSGLTISETPAAWCPAMPTDDAWDGPSVLTALDAVVRNNGYPLQEEALLSRFQAVGIGTTIPFDPATCSPEIQNAIAHGYEKAIALVNSAVALRGRPAGESGWRTVSPGSYGYNYLSRAAANLAGLGGTSRDESGPYTTHVDGVGRQLDGRQDSYRLDFRPPPVDAFWSLTIYGLESRRLVPNPIDRHVINSVTDDLPWGADGTLQIHVGTEPGPVGTFWLPAPPEPFYVVLRAYLGHPEVVNGSWTPCPVQRVADDR